MNFKKRNVIRALKTREILLFVPLLIWSIIFAFVFYGGGLSYSAIIIMISLALYLVGGPFLGIVISHRAIRKHKESDVEQIKVTNLTLISLILGALLAIFLFPHDEALFGGGSTGLFIASLMALSGLLGTYTLIRAFVGLIVNRIGDN